MSLLTGTSVFKDGKSRYRVPGWTWLIQRHFPSPHYVQTQFAKGCSFDRKKVLVSRAKAFSFAAKTFSFRSKTNIFLSLDICTYKLDFWLQCKKQIHRHKRKPCWATDCNVEYQEVTHGLYDVAGEDVDLEVLGAPVTLSEGETVAFHRTLSSTSTEQHLVDGEWGDLCTRGLVRNSGRVRVLVQT